MSETGSCEVWHETTVNAPAEKIYRFVVEDANWPQILAPVVHIARKQMKGPRQQLRVWAARNGAVTESTYLRVLDPTAFRIEFRQQNPVPPVAELKGLWDIEPVGEGRSRVRLSYDLRILEQDVRSKDAIREELHSECQAALDALRYTLELSSGARYDRLLTFDDSVTIEGSAKEVYDFLKDADQWPGLLPHVTKVVLSEESPGVQILQIESLADNGSTRHATSARVCFSDEKIVYKQLTLPPVMTAHLGHWVLNEKASGVTATSHQTVLLDEAGIAALMGPDPDLDEARQRVFSTLSADVRAILRCAKEHVEGRRGTAGS